ncbi:hypothetical protein [Streptomyces sp. NPDC052015]|uniref:hypothetical protein n=1 Tax=Streptomyces sp. NPDC052015 TaxID=3154755 RepID=UPI003434BB13
MMADDAGRPEPPTRAQDFEDDRTAPRLSTDRWVDHYLPHWTLPERSRARYDLDDAGLRLRIDPDQPDWREEDAPLPVSNVQTGLFSGPVGSRPGTHREHQRGAPTDLVLFVYDRIPADSVQIDGDAGLLDLLRAWDPEE